MVHRIIYELAISKIPLGMQIDHIDGNKINNKIDNLRIVTFTENNRNKNYRGSISGAVGVVRFTINKHTYFRAIWNSLYGRQFSKTFSVSKYGEKEAFAFACEYRTRMIAELNEQGAGYTERHGTTTMG